MTNDCIRIGLSSDCSTLKRLSMLCYKELKRFHIPSYYKLCAISKATGILASRKKSIKRGYLTKDPYLRNPILVSCYGFGIINGKLRFGLGNKKFEEIPLNKHTQKVLSDPLLKVNSFTLTENSLSLCISKEVEEIVPVEAVGIDRNLNNLTVGNRKQVEYYDMKKVVEIGETMKDIVKSFRRNDVRIRREISSKHGKRKAERVKRILHVVSKIVVQNALANKQAIVFEDIRGVRDNFAKGDFKGPQFRRQMNNHWPFYEIKRQIEYKAQWAGVPIIQLTRDETEGTSFECPRCGERLQVGSKRKVKCLKCNREMDRDLVAVLNISRKGWLRFDHSEGAGSEAMVEEPDDAVILRVDPANLAQLTKS